MIGKYCDPCQIMLPSSGRKIANLRVFHYHGISVLHANRKSAYNLHLLADLLGPPNPHAEYISEPLFLQKFHVFPAHYYPITDQDHPLDLSTGLKVQISASPFLLDVCNAMTEGSIGSMLEEPLQNEFRRSSLEKEIATLVTQVVVNQNDPAFNNLAKPACPFYTQARAQELLEKKKWTLVEDSGKGYRKVVSLSKAIDVVNKGVVKELVSLSLLQIT